MTMRTKKTKRTRTAMKSCRLSESPTNKPHAPRLSPEVTTAVRSYAATTVALAGSVALGAERATIDPPSAGA
jgi:hypothetical protein